MATNKLDLSRVIKPETVDLNGGGFREKKDLLDHMITMLFNAGIVDSKEEFLKAIYVRESMGPTYMDNFIAIPHGKSKTVKSPGASFCRCTDGVFYDTQLGGGIVKLIFMLAIPEKMNAQEYIRILSRLARLLVHNEFIDSLYEANNYSDLLIAIQDGEKLLVQ